MAGSLFGRLRKTESGDDKAFDCAVGERELAQRINPAVDESPGGLTFEEGTAGGLGRHLGVTSCTLLIVGTIIGSGIFSTPSSILLGVGSVGASLMLWVLGFVLSFCGLFIWLEFGTMYPRSGGEKVYLEAIYTRPKYLATMLFAAQIIVLGFSSAGCIVFAGNILVSAGQAPTVWTERGIAVGAIVFATLVHGLTPRIGVHLMNFLSIFKVAILLFIVVAGWAVLSGKTRIANPQANFVNAFAGSSRSSSDYATAAFKVLYTFNGWAGANYVLNNVRNPIRTLKIAGPLGLGICATLYILANIAYFSAATKEEIESSGVTVAALFFRNVFGSTAERALAVFVALSALGNVVTSTFTISRINQAMRMASFPPELAKEGIPLPFGNRFWASNWPTGEAPLPGLIIHLITSIIVILAPPINVAYPFILDVQSYPSQIINCLVVVGLFWLRWRRPDIPRPFKVWLPLAVFYLATSLFLLIAPFLPPVDGIGDTPPLPYYLYCLVAIGTLLAAVGYWAVWRLLLPKVFGYKLVPCKVKLEDGTVVTVFSHREV